MPDATPSAVLSYLRAVRDVYVTPLGLDGAGALVNEVAWHFREQGVRLHRKTTGANHKGWAVDILIIGGKMYDVLRDSEGMGEPQMAETVGTPDPLMPEPVAEVPIPDPGTPEMGNVEEILGNILLELQKITAHLREP